MRRLMLLVLLAAMLCGCGVGVQGSPERISVRLPAEAPTSPSAGPAVDTVFFVRGTRLQAVLRRTSTTGSLREALALLSVGPSPAEAQGGTRTALAPQPISVLGLDDRGTLTLGVSRQFTAVVGGDQLLAVAQVVWTVTEFPWVEGVRFVSAGQNLEVPTDHGLVQRTVLRDDYRAVAPPAGPAQSTPAPPS